MNLDDKGKSEATHFILSRAIDVWIKDKPTEDKTDLMNFLIEQMNWWLEWKYHPSAAVFESPAKRPECLCGGQLDTRIWNAMVNDGHMTLEDMAKHSDRELLRTPNFGRKSLKRLRDLVPR